MKGIDEQHWDYSGRGMMHAKENRVKGLCKDQIAKNKAGANSLLWDNRNSCKSRTYATQIGKWRGLQQRDNVQQVT